MPWRCVAISLLLLAACKQPDPEVCRRQAEELGTFLTTMDHDMVTPLGGVTLAKRDDLVVRSTYAVHALRIRPESIHLGDEPVSDSDLRARLAELQTQSKTTELGFLIDEATPWERVVLALTSAHTAGMRPVLVFARSPRGSPPPPSPADAELDAALAASKNGPATTLAKYLEVLVAKCPQVVEVFGEVAAVEGPRRTTHMLSRIGPAVAACGCKVDIPRLRTTMWRFVGNQNPTSSLALEVAPEGKAIELPAATPWREASRSFTPQTAKIWPASR